MLLDIKCKAVTSVAVHLKFDDNTTKDVVIAHDDLIDVEFNQNGLRKRMQGKVICIKAIGPDPKAWSIIVDGSDDFESTKARFSPMNILDVVILKKADATKYIETPNDYTGITGLRIVRGRLQYTVDGYNWSDIRMHHHNIIEDEEGTVPDTNIKSDDIIQDEVL